MAFDLASGVERQRYRLRTLCLVRAACALETGPFVLEFVFAGRAGSQQRLEGESEAEAADYSRAFEADYSP